ncbi:MAG TPA: glycosyltransferase, partial [Bdellovibrionota bacterium]|nr:glycosyltransferase [Bdellovibrionota bacterium]
MKLLYLTHQYFPRHIGGTEVYLRGIVRRAVAAGHECRIISCHEDPSQNPDDFHVEQTEFEGVPILEIHFNLSVTKNPARFEYFNPFVQETVLSELEIFHPHLVHAMHAMKLSGSALRACRVSCVPIIVTLCDYWFICPRHTLLKWDDSLCDGPSTSFKCLPCLRQLHRFAVLPKNPSKLGLFLREVRAISGRSQFLRQELLRANRIIALSHFQKEMFVKNGYPHDRIEVVPHGIEVSDLVIGEHVPNFSGKLRIGFIGNLVPFKGAHILIEAITRDPSLQVECLIYGPLTESLYCRKLRDKAANDQRIKFMGKFPTDQLGCVLR